MKTEYLYILEIGSKKFPCPECGKRTLVRYIDTETREYLPKDYGRCDRESKCAYHLNPYLDGYAAMIKNEGQKVTGVTQVTSGKQKYFRPKQRQMNPSKTYEEQKTVYFNVEAFTKTLEGYEKNSFIQNLLSGVSFPFEAGDITKVIELYRLGTIPEGYRVGAVTFPFIDWGGNIRTVQVKEFDKYNHTTGTDFLHSLLEKSCIRNKEPLPEWLREYAHNEKKVSCLFGEHLLKKYPLHPVALVEAPKTAVYGALYFGFPEQCLENLIWLAVYNKSSFSPDKLSVLQGRNVLVFPDLSRDGLTYKEWESKARKMERALPGTSFIFSDLLERLAPEQDKVKGRDLADYLIQQDWRLFRKEPLQGKAEARPKLHRTSESQNEIKAPADYEKIMGHAENRHHEAVQIKTTQSARPPEKDKVLLESHKIPAEKTIRKYHEDWNKEIETLENFFSDTEFSGSSISLNPCSRISDVQKFIKNHLSVVRANNGNRVYFPYLSRLQELKDSIISVH